VADNTSSFGSLGVVGAVIAAFLTEDEHPTICTLAVFNLGHTYIVTIRPLFTKGTYPLLGLCWAIQTATNESLYLCILQEHQSPTRGPGLEKVTTL